jgi:hypothetical protein
MSFLKRGVVVDFLAFGTVLFSEIEPARVLYVDVNVSKRHRCPCLNRAVYICTFKDFCPNLPLVGEGPQKPDVSVLVFLLKASSVRNLKC